MKGISTLRKAQLIDAMVAQDEKEGIVSGAENTGYNQEEKFPIDEKNTAAEPEVSEPEWVDVFAEPDASEPYPAESGELFSAGTESEKLFSAASGTEESFSMAPEVNEAAFAASGMEEQQASAASGGTEALPERNAAEAETNSAGSGESTVQESSQGKRSYRNETVRNRTESGRSEERTYRNTRTAGQTDDQGRSFQRRRHVTENETRSSYDRGNGERRIYDRTRPRADQNNSYDSRRSYGNQNNSYENRRSYNSQNNSSDNRWNYGEQDNPSDNRRTYADAGSSYDSRKNNGERMNSYADQEELADNRRNYLNQNTVSETRSGYENPNHVPEAQPTAEQRFTDADRPPAELSQLDSGQSVSGILEVMPDGYGFIRSDNYLPGENDVYVSPSQIRRFNLKTGDIISGNTRIKSQQEKFSALLYLKKINGLIPSEAMKRYNFEDMTPVFPNERLRMERDSRGIAMRIVDLFSPIGKGQRGMIVSPPKAGKTTLLKDVARSILKNNPEMRLLILLIDERPEEVTDIKEAICGENVEVIYSTFDETPEHHKRVSEMVIERAKRLVEQKQDVIILLDSITRLARAYNLTVPPSGRTLSGGLDPAALHMPKRFFGAARNMREGGSLTILATALVDTGSKMDDVVYEEFKGTGNMELVLDRKLSERRVFPAIDIPKSGTRREDLLLDREEQEAIYYMRRALNGMKSDDAVESILNMLMHTRDNRDFVTRVRRQKGV
ncbi:MAG: transcription termination factor Rho [Lachnospiraceae bacterium]|nr:transcription termination factor Rho [Lachnospiraceae bacterium]